MVVNEAIIYSCFYSRFVSALNSRIEKVVEAKRRYRILFITRVPITADKFVLPFAMKMQREGHHVEFAFGIGNSLQRIIKTGIPFTYLPLSFNSLSIKNCLSIWTIKKLVRSHEIDIVYTYSPIIGILGRIGAKIGGARTIVHVVIGSMFGPGVPVSHKIYHWITEKILGRWVDLYITLGDSEAEGILTRNIVSRDHIRSLNYEFGVDLTQFDPERFTYESRDQMRIDLKIAKNIPVIGFIGRMIGSKGILDLYEAFLKLRTQGVRTNLLYVGDVLSSDTDTESQEQLKLLVHKHGLEKEVHFVGFQEDTPRFISIMDVVVMPSHYEGFPRIPIEAGALGKPSVVTAVQGAQIAVEDGCTGFIVAINDPDQIADAIKKILANGIEAQKMGMVAHERAVNLFDEKIIVEDQVRFFEQALANSLDSYSL